MVFGVTVGEEGARAGGAWMRSFGLASLVDTVIAICESV